jgi:hypothetical protein
MTYLLGNPCYTVLNLFIDPCYTGLNLFIDPILTYSKHVNLSILIRFYPCFIVIKI